MAGERRPVDAKEVEEAADVLDQRFDIVAGVRTIGSAVAPAREARDAEALAEPRREATVEPRCPVEAAEQGQGPAGAAASRCTGG
jgi:hypothetical protein